MLDKTKNYKYKFSVIIPVYNVEKYLEEAIESVINQNIGFKKNIQLILVNDGSTDNSRQICTKYKTKYSDNVIYIEQENKGVSAARNVGMKCVQGKYINYLDADDKWENNVFSKVYKMFEKNEQIDVIGVRQKFFESLNKWAPLDYKFEEDRIIDIHEQYDCIQLSVTSAFIRVEAIKDKKFDENVKYGEDIKFLSEIILKKERYGVIATSLHLYRKREENNSAIQKSKDDVSWYLDSTKLVLKYLYEISLKKYKKIIPYIQYCVMYDLQWRLFSKISNNISEVQKSEYIGIIKDLLNNIDDSIIFMQRNLVREQKVYCLSLKYGKDIKKDFKYVDGNIMFNDILVNDIKTQKFIEICIMEIKNNEMYLEGKLRDYYSSEDYELFIKGNNENITKVEAYDMPTLNKYSFMDECYFKGIGFRVQIPLKNIKSLKMMINYRSNISEVYMAFTRLSRLNEKMKKMYVIKENNIITTENNEIFIEEYSKKSHIKYEFIYSWNLFIQRKYKLILIRILYYIMKIIKRKPIWLVSDRAFIANDNGEHIFKYLVQNEKNAIVYFVIDKKSNDYSRIRKIGKVISHHSFKHKLYFLLSSKIISSQADEWGVLNVIGKKEKYLRDLYKFHFIFLQHGIIKDDLSRLYNKLNKNISIFVTSAKGEYKSIAYGNYGYTENEVKLTGLPRYDNLMDDKQKQIVFMPTWRATLSGKVNKNTGERQYNNGFKNTDYFKFYNKLINDERLLNSLKEKGYKAKFFIHPCLGQQWSDFQDNELVEIQKSADYQKEFKENALLITDFSSVAFDFGYLRKPVVYTQFDIDTFFESQLYDKGYFEYEEEGFGPVCYTYQKALEEIINLVKNDCKIEQKYLNRINNFYAYNDKNNCKRLHDEILKLK